MYVGTANMCTICEPIHLIINKIRCFQFSERKILLKKDYNIHASFSIPNSTSCSSILGNNTASNISKLSKISRAASASDIWTILKYYKPVLFPNTTYNSCYYLFIIQGNYLILPE